jgi:type I restriction enzyme M protein
MSKHQELSSFIWNVCDDVLRGLFKQHEYGDVILPFVVLRRLDCVLEPNKDEIYNLYEEYKGKVDDPSPIIKNTVKKEFYNHSKYDLIRLKSDPKNIYMNFQNYINGYSKNVYEIIENFQFEKPVEKLNKNNKLYLLIDKFTEIDLHPSVVDNHTMGQIFEELLRKFSEMSNETSGEHYTPRDIVKLLVSLVFSENKEDLQGEGKIRSIFDPCCGTGGMLTMGKEWILGNINPNIEIKTSGQELNPQTYSICKSDMLISGENPDNIKLGSSLSEDGFQGNRFDYMITNPPFGVSWKSEREFIDNESKNPQGRFSVGTPRISDGSLLFLQHMISKMEPKGSRIGVVFNGSPSFTGESESGESEIRKWILNNDLLECIVKLPNELFFNTPITTYIWVISNKKRVERKNKVQLIDGSNFFKNRQKPLGEKKKDLTEDNIRELLTTYLDYKNNDICKIVSNEDFFYTKITIESPIIKKGEIVRDEKGNPKPDKSLRDYEKVEFGNPIEKFFTEEILPHRPNSYVDRTLDSIGCEILFNKIFYKRPEINSEIELTKQLLLLENKSEGILKKLLS